MTREVGGGGGGGGGEVLLTIAYSILGGSARKMYSGFRYMKAKGRDFTS